MPAAAGRRRVTWTTPRRPPHPASTDQPPSRTRFYRDKRNGKILGVCAGIADYTGFDVNLVRVCMVAAVFLSSGSILPFYFIAAFVAPDRPRRSRITDREDKQLLAGRPRVADPTARDIKWPLQGHRPPARRHRKLCDDRKPLTGARDRATAARSSKQELRSMTADHDSNRRTDDLHSSSG